MDIEVTTYKYIDAIALEKACVAALDAMAHYGNQGEEMRNIAEILLLAKIESARHFRNRERESSAEKTNEA